MVINQVIDNASVAMASVNRGPVANARAIRHPRDGGATIFGLLAISLSRRMGGLGERHGGARVDYHDAFLAADCSHPGDIPPNLAVAQQKRAGRCRTAAWHRHELQIRLISQHLPARAQNRSSHRSVGVGGHRHAFRAGYGDDLSVGTAGSARYLHHAAVAQGRDSLEGLCARSCRCGDRSCRPLHAGEARRRRSMRAKTA